jgi:hypothetical protein
MSTRSNISNGDVTRLRKQTTGGLMDSSAPFGTRSFRNRSVLTTRKYKRDSTSLIWRTASTKLTRFVFKPSAGTLFSTMSLAVKRTSSDLVTCFGLLGPSSHQAFTQLLPLSTHPVVVSHGSLKYYLIVYSSIIL